MKSFRFCFVAFLLAFLLNVAAGQVFSASAPSDTLYRSASLIIVQLSKNVYIHTTYLQSETFGHVACNGMIVTGGKEAVVFDTPADDSSSAELIGFIHGRLNTRIRTVIPTHFHGDCLGGLNEFHKNKIPSLASNRTIALARSRNFNVPQKGFQDSVTLSVGGQLVMVKFFGEGHTTDNIVAYVPGEEVLFGGCLLKSLDAGKGNLEDANQLEWSATVTKVKNAYPAVKKVIPGHGAAGDGALLDFTINLFKHD